MIFVGFMLMNNLIQKAVAYTFFNVYYTLEKGYIVFIKYNMIMKFD